MGLIRKTLAVGTLGTVHGSSKKQRVAAQTLQATRSGTAASIMQVQLMAELSGNVAAKRSALLLEMQALPNSAGSLSRIRQISRELDALR